MRKQGLFKSSLPIPGSDDRIVLMFWATSDEARFQNVVRVDRDGTVKWSAELPGNAERDCFVSLRRRDDVYVARTYSGHEICLDANGRTVKLTSSRQLSPGRELIQSA